jgi:hypothetical protein
MVRQAKIREDRVVGTGHDVYDFRSERAARVRNDVGSAAPSVRKFVHRPDQLLLRLVAPAKGAARRRGAL